MRLLSSIALSFAILFGAHASSFATSPTAPGETKADLVVIDEDYELKSHDGLTLRGLIIRPELAEARPLPTVIVLHPLGRTHANVLDFADRLANRGIAVVAPDLRGHGDSLALADGRFLSFFLKDLSALHDAVGDLEAIVDDITQDARFDAERIAFVGISQGALVAFEEAARDPRPRAIAVVDPPQSAGGFDPRRDLSIIGARPVLLLCSALPASSGQAALLAEYGSGERKVHCVDSYLLQDRLINGNDAAAEEVVSWLARTLEVEKLPSRD